jgi:hypothetical protein
MTVNFPAPMLSKPITAWEHLRYGIVGNSPSPASHFVNKRAYNQKRETNRLLVRTGLREWQNTNAYILNHTPIEYRSGVRYTIVSCWPCEV